MRTEVILRFTQTGNFVTSASKSFVVISESEMVGRNYAISIASIDDIYFEKENAP